MCIVPKGSQDEQITISNRKQLTTVAHLLNVTEDEMRRSLTERVIAARGEIMTKTHDTTQAEFGRDALAKAIYDRLFTWIIQRINKAIVVPGGNTQKRYNRVIGVLDIYGFEIFDLNSFEQFCINYCNEKLQQLFIELVLKQEQEEYRREGIEWTNVEYFNNQFALVNIRRKCKLFILKVGKFLILPCILEQNRCIGKSGWLAGWKVKCLNGEFLILEAHPEDWVDEALGTEFDFEHFILLRE
ncbi:myosin i [Culex quinquefasciatus]|uniref:Myosin i n=1 Tax=Culex quinquefasciatus TaxID=7176 RepID=B0XKR8_CULQU|nr:myosin i [Culex quinquefasciatus]|eukprot:XP_001870240.1 myosin i [Culex quinquefasciatus]